MSMITTIGMCNLDTRSKEGMITYYACNGQKTEEDTKYKGGDIFAATGVWSAVSGEVWAKTVHY